MNVYMLVSCHYKNWCRADIRRFRFYLSSVTLEFLKRVSGCRQRDEVKKQTNKKRIVKVYSGFMKLISSNEDKVHLKGMTRLNTYFNKLFTNLKNNSINEEYVSLEVECTTCK